jgi:uncharacterized protein
VGVAAHWEPRNRGRRRLSKILLIVIGLVLVYWIVKGFHRRGGRRAPPAARRGEDMVRCERCGVHLPRSESITTRGRFYCTPEHEREHQGQ